MILVLVAGTWWLLTKDTRGAEIATVLALPLVVLSLLVAVVAVVAVRPTFTCEEIETAKADLAGALRQQWGDEDPLPRRHIGEKRPMPVRWEVTSAAEAVMSGASTDGTRTPSERPAGDFNDILAVFSQLPSRRLVVLGTAGAGKSVLVSNLASRLLSVRTPGDPVPIIVRAARWDPNKKLSDWIADELARQYPGLCVGGRANGKTRAQALVTSGAVLPIIDGLDEMPRPLRLKAVAKINKYGSDNPLVVTSRTDEYLDAVGKERARVVLQAVVVELCPLRAADIKDYLHETTAVIPVDRWDRVFDRLDAEPDGPLTDTLANPLMLWLVGTVYERAERDPDELADRARLASRATIERHLLAQFVPAVYADHPEQGSSRQFRCTPRQAQRWLGFLAEGFSVPDTAVAYTRRNRDRVGVPAALDLAWWRFPRAVHSWRLLGMGLRVALLSSVMWALVVWVLSQHGSWREGVYVGSTDLRDILLGGPLGHLIRPTVDQIFPFAPSAVRDIPQALSTLIQKAKEIPSFAMYVCLFVFGTTLGNIQLAIADDRPPKRLKIRPAKTVGAVLGGIFWFAYLSAALMMLILSAKSDQPGIVRDFFDSPSTWMTLFAVSLIGVIRVPPSFTTPIDVSSAVSPAEVLRLDWQADIVVTLSKRAIFAVAVWLYSGLQIALAYMVFAVAATLVRIVLGGQRAFVSRAYTDARFWFACRGRLPWRTMSFLDDAERQREVLRQVGAVYQFRHIRLEQQLRDWWRWGRLLERWSRREALRDLVRRLGQRANELSLRSAHR
jgi:hypothetical protein